VPTRRFDNLDPDRRQLLLQAAAEEFAANGYEGASIARILEGSGFSKGSLYYYFEDKRDLYTTVVQDRVVTWMSSITPPTPVDNADAYWAEVERLVWSSIHAYEADPCLSGLVRSLAELDGPAATLVQTRELMRAWTEALIDLGQHLGAVRSDLPRSMVLALASAVSEGLDVWFAEHWQAVPEPQRDALVAEVVDLYRRLARPPDLQE
jgi:AcrR family transcriptional regulator